MTELIRIFTVLAKTFFPSSLVSGTMKYPYQWASPAEQRNVLCGFLKNKNLSVIINRIIAVYQARINGSW